MVSIPTSHFVPAMAQNYCILHHGPFVDIFNLGTFCEPMMTSTSPTGSRNRSNLRQPLGSPRPSPVDHSFEMSCPQTWDDLVPSVRLIPSGRKLGKQISASDFYLWGRLFGGTWGLLFCTDLEPRMLSYRAEAKWSKPMWTSPNPYAPVAFSVSIPDTY